MKKNTWNVFIGRESESVGFVTAEDRKEAYEKAKEKFAELLAKKDPVTGNFLSLFVTQSYPGQ